MIGHSGIGTYIRGLLAALPKLDPPVDVVPLGAEHGLTARPLGLPEQIAVPRAMRRLDPPAALLHVPNYNAPIRYRDPMVVTIHDLIHALHPEAARHPLAGPFARFLLPRVCRRARVLICASDATRRDLVAFCPEAAAHARTILLGCDLARPPDEQRVRTLARHGLAPGYVLYVGNLRPHKNVDLLIRAHAALPERIRPPLVLVGADQMPAGWPPRNEASPRRLGIVPPEDLPGLYAGASVLVFPSRFEGFGMPPLEAMACGTPVIGSTAGAQAEVVGDAGILCDPSSEAAFVAALTQVLSDPALREAMSRKGLARAREFTWERTAIETRKAYEDALGAPGDGV